jgi:hypothetical protein
MRRADLVPGSKGQELVQEEREVNGTHRPWSQTLFGVLYGIFRKCGVGGGLGMVVSGG